jgi:hypothetical protein
MPISTKPAVGTTATVAVAGTAVQPSTPLPDNTHTVIVYNPNGAAVIYVGWAPNSGAFNIATAVQVPASASLTLSVGPRSQRPAASTDLLFINALVPGATANLTYVNGVNL